MKNLVLSSGIVATVTVIPGEMVGRRLVREWDPATGATRTWHETLDGAGNIRQVRPQTGGAKVHYRFDANGKYVGKW